MLHSLPFFLLFVPPFSGGEPSAAETPQWGGFRGNNGAGVSTTTGLPDALDPESNLIWRVDVPAGYSSPVIAGKNLYLTGAEVKGQRGQMEGKLVTVCLDAFTGEPRWRDERDFAGPRPGGNSAAAPSPAADGEVVVALFHHFGLLAFDPSGKELWQKNIGPFNIPHGMATSPLLYRDLVLLQVDQDPMQAKAEGGADAPARNAYIAAYDKRTGAERWKVQRPGVTHSYATPAVWEPKEGLPQLVVSGSFQLAAYDLARGEKLWWLDGMAWQTKSVPLFAGGRCYLNAFMQSLSEMEMPTFSGAFADVLQKNDADHDGKIAQSEYGDPKLHQIWFIFDLDGDELLGKEEWEFALSTEKATGGLYAIELGGKGALAQSKLKWKSEDRRGLSDVTSPVVVGETLFVISDGGLLTAFDLASGKVVKQERVGEPDQYYASPVAGDGKLYLAGLSGVLTVVKAVPDFEALSTHALGEEEVWATPAIAGHAVYVRSKEALFCFEDSK